MDSVAFQSKVMETVRGIKDNPFPEDVIVFFDLAFTLAFVLEDGFIDLGVFPLVGKSVHQSGTISTVKNKKD